jgi:hypothetical protein
MVVMGAFAALEFGAGWVLSQTPPSSVWDDATMRGLCICGSVLGGLLSVMAIPKRNDGESWREIGFKGVASTICGVLLTPIVIRHCGWAIDSDTVMGWSGIVAAMSVGTIHVVWPIWIRFAKKFARKYIGDDSGVLEKRK